MDADVLIVGGGVAGLSLAAQLAPRRRVILLEAEPALGHHSSGRSATFSHFGIGNRVVRALTSHSRAFFEAPPPGFSETPLSRRASALFVATSSMLAELDALHSVMELHAGRLERCDAARMQTLFPPLRTGGDGAVAGLLDPDGLRLDSNALLQGYTRAVRQAGGIVVTGSPVAKVEQSAAGWSVTCTDGSRYEASILVNAAGAWAEHVAGLAGLPPIGLQPLRRTIIVIDPTADATIGDWPFVKTVVDDFYILPEAGRLIASPVDEVPSEPCDAQPEDYDVALAASKVEEYTTLPVRRVSHRWAGLRTFAPDRVPIAGFDPRASGFFWLAGQGGFGLHTAPAVAEAAAALVLGVDWPHALAAHDVHAHDLAPERLING